jgi:hypothetical protein
VAARALVICGGSSSIRASHKDSDTCPCLSLSFYFHRPCTRRSRSGLPNQQWGRSGKEGIPPTPLCRAPFRTRRQERAACLALGRRPHSSSACTHCDCERPRKRIPQPREPGTGTVFLLVLYYYSNNNNKINSCWSVFFPSGCSQPVIS